MGIFFFIRYLRIEESEEPIMQAAAQEGKEGPEPAVLRTCLHGTPASAHRLNELCRIAEIEYLTRSMKVLFLDESGDHSLEVIDPQYPLFVLGGIMVDVDYAKGAMTERINAFKRNFLGTEDIILHTADMVRNRRGFEQLANPEFRERFYRELNALLSGLQFQIVACAIRKEDHLSRYGFAAVDPYHLGLEVLVERFCYEVGDRAGGGVIVAEKRDRILDRQLRLAWLTLKTGGTRFVQAVQLAKRLRGLALRGKEANIAGLQVADLIVTPIGRSLLGKTSLVDYRIIQSKFRCNHRREYDGMGLVVLPKS